MELFEGPVWMGFRSAFAAMSACLALLALWRFGQFVRSGKGVQLSIAQVALVMEAIANMRMSLLFL